MWANASALTLRVPQGDIPIKLCDKIHVSNAQGFKTHRYIDNYPHTYPLKQKKLPKRSSFAYFNGKQAYCTCMVLLNLLPSG
jgi:hypothetical protein